MCSCAHRGQKRLLDPQKGNSKQDFKNFKYANPIQRYTKLICAREQPEENIESHLLFCFLLLLYEQISLCICSKDAAVPNIRVSGVSQGGSDSLCCTAWCGCIHRANYTSVVSAKAAGEPRNATREIAAQDLRFITCWSLSFWLSAAFSQCVHSVTQLKNPGSRVR